MTEILKRQFDLLALQVALRVQGEVQKADLKLEYYAREDEPLLEAWTVDAASLQDGPNESLSLQLTRLSTSETTHPQAPGPASMPPQLTLVGTRIAETLGVASVPESAPIWLHLAKPYGWLGTLPWEAALEAATGRSVLRLPDFLERSRENLESLDVVVCSDLADAPSTVGQIERAVKCVLDGSPRSQTHVHVFALPGNSHALRSTFRADSRVWIAPPPPSTNGSESSPWISAIEQALRERSADAIHFICRASAMAGRPSLRLADPSRDGEFATARFPSTGEISALLTRIGAWAAIFSLPNGEPDYHLRWFADALAQARPGAVLYDAGGDVSRLYRFLFAPQASPPPHLGSNFVYCQPSITTVEDPALARIMALSQNAHLFLNVAAKVSAHPTLELAASLAGKAASAIPAIAEILGLRAPTAPAGSNATPTWVAAAQRYVEAQSLDIVRSRSKDPLLADRIRTIANPEQDHESASPSQTQASDIADQTLSQLQSIVAKYAPKAE